MYIERKSINTLLKEKKKWNASAENESWSWSALVSDSNCFSEVTALQTVHLQCKHGVAHQPQWKKKQQKTFTSLPPHGDHMQLDSNKEAKDAV